MRLNLGSGQKHMDGYVNVDISSDHGHQIDVEADVSGPLPFDDCVAEGIIAEHILEHIYLHKQEAALREWWRILKPGGHLVICVPDLEALAKAYLSGKIDFFIYAANKFGPYNGNDADFHKWGFDERELRNRLGVIPWQSITRGASGAPVARDWWILEVACIK
jgi:SAM-dependent methyltransferase